MGLPLRLDFEVGLESQVPFHVIYHYLPPLKKQYMEPENHPFGKEKKIIFESFTFGFHMNSFGGVFQASFPVKKKAFFSTRLPNYEIRFCPPPFTSFQWMMMLLPAISNAHDVHTHVQHTHGIHDHFLWRATGGLALRMSLGIYGLDCVTAESRPICISNLY